MLCCCVIIQIWDIWYEYQSQYHCQDHIWQINLYNIFYKLEIIIVFDMYCIYSGLPSAKTYTFCWFRLLIFRRSESAVRLHPTLYVKSNLQGSILYVTNPTYGAYITRLRYFNYWCAFGSYFNNTYISLNQRTFKNVKDLRNPADDWVLISLPLTTSNSAWFISNEHDTTSLVCDFFTSTVVLILSLEFLSFCRNFIALNMCFYLGVQLVTMMPSRGSLGILSWDS